MDESPAPLFEEDFEKLFPKNDKKVDLPDGNYEYCPECNGEVRKVYSSVGVVFKGSGFYKTDSAKPAPTSSSD